MSKAPVELTPFDAAKHPIATPAPTVPLVPVANFCRLVKELLAGEWSWARLLLTIAANLVYAAVAFAWAVRNFKNESILFRA